MKCIIIELNNSVKRYCFDDKWIHAESKKYGFSSYTSSPFMRQLKLIGNYCNKNGIYIRNTEYVRLRLKSSEKTIMHGFNF